MKRKYLYVSLVLFAALGLCLSPGRRSSQPASAASVQAQDYVLTASGWSSKQDEAVTRAGGTVTYSHKKAGIAVVTSENPEFLNQVLASNAVTSGAVDEVVQWQMPVREVMLDEQAVNPANESFINAQWNHLAVNAPGAWAAGWDGTGVRVAVLDGGIHNTHIDLVGRVDLAASTSFVPPHPFNFDTGTFWHGTHVAGIVAANDNLAGTVGIAPGATIIGVKVLHSGSGSFGAVISGILYASTPTADGGAGADIINMSLGAVFPKNATGGGQLVAALNKAVNYAGSKGVLVVSAAGNSGIDFDHSGNLISVPAMSGSGIAVSATGPVGYAVGWPAGATNFRRPASYTNFGNSLVNVAGPGGDFALPGTAICSIPRVPSGPPLTAPCWVFDMVLSTSRGSGASISSYTWAAGTSMAAPAVSGVAALVKQKNPGISLGALKNKIQNSADDEGANGHDPFYGRGFVNASKAVQ